MLILSWRVRLPYLYIMIYWLILAKPIKNLELHYPMIQLLITLVILTIVLIQTHTYSPYIIIFVSISPHSTMMTYSRRNGMQYFYRSFSFQNVYQNWFLSIFDGLNIFCKVSILLHTAAVISSWSMHDVARNMVTSTTCSKSSESHHSSRRFAVKNVFGNSRAYLGPSNKQSS